MTIKVKLTCPYCKGTGICEPTFAARIRSLRNDKKLTQDQLARELRISRGQLANIETGRSGPSLETVMAAASLFNVSTDFLLGMKEGET